MGDAQVFDYYYGDESSQFSFYRIPRLLIRDKSCARPTMWTLTPGRASGPVWKSGRRIISPRPTPGKQCSGCRQDNGIMTGDASGDLMLSQPMTRQQFAAMLYRYHDMRE